MDFARRALRDVTLGPSILVWTFGYVLVDIVSVLIGNTGPVLYLVFALPMLFLGAVQTVGLARFSRMLQPSGPATRWPLLLAATLLATAIQSLFDMYWMRWVSLTLVPGWQTWALDTGVEKFATNCVIYFWTFALTLTLIWAVRTNVTAEAAATRAATAEAAAAKAQAAALRLQLNPHFMFNTLNSISSLVLTDRKREADEMLGRLSDFLRSSLQSDPAADVPLAQEIDTIDAYLALEAARFGDTLRIEIDVDPDLADVPVPNFILQPLVENAIKHGAAKVRGGAFLQVSAVRQAEELLLCVRNSLADPDHADALPPADPREPIGLDNIRRRLAVRYGRRASLDIRQNATDHFAAIRIPLDATIAPAGTAAASSR